MVSKLYTIIGDANVRRNMIGMNIASRESMKAAQIIDCVSMATLDDALREVRDESDVLIIAAITEFILASGDCGTIFSSVDPVFSAPATKLNDFCGFRPSLKACYRCFNFFVKVVNQ